MEQKKTNLIEAAVEFLSRGTSTSPLNEADDEELQFIKDMIFEAMDAKNTTITLGGKKHPMNKMPIEHHAEFKKQYPGVRTRYRGKRETLDQLQARSGGSKGNTSSSMGTFKGSNKSSDRSPSTQDTLKKNATHFYAHPADVEAAGHKVK
jgi:hypothetical protein